jgi:hypothetical protein
VSDHLNAARKVLAEFWRPLFTVPGTFIAPDGAADALDRAGLLRSDLHERALRACEAMAEDKHDTYKAINASAIGRESLALKQPKPRWHVAGESMGTDPFIDVFDTYDSCGPAARFFGKDRAENARAYAASKNALDAQEGRP